MVRRSDPDPRWLAFLRSHGGVIAAFDFFTVPMVTFRLFYGFFCHRARTSPDLALQVTPRPTSEWIIQQLREAFPEPCHIAT
jgi:hypothetical protein